MLRPLCALLLALLLATGLAAGRGAAGEAILAVGSTAARGGGRPTVLVVTETEGFRHGASIAAGLRELRRLGDRPRGGFPVVELTRFAELTPERLAEARALVLLQTSGTPELDGAGRARLLAAIRGGLPLLAFHASVSTFPDWAAFHRLLRADFRDHPNVGVGRIRVEDRAHPATARLPRAYRAREEFYRLRGPRTPRRGAHVLASLDVSSVGGRPRGDRPLVWWRTEGRGRVFVSLLGHRPETWGTIRHRRLVAGAMDWGLVPRR